MSLHDAVWRGDIQAVRHLLQTGERRTDGLVVTGLSSSLSPSPLSPAPVMICQTATNRLIQDKGPQSQTPLHVAAARGHVEIARLLALEYGANIEATDVYGRTPLLLACIEGHLPALRFLLEECHANGKKRYRLYFATILHIAAATGNASMVRYLVQQSRRVAQGERQGEKKDEGANEHPSPTLLLSATLLEDTTREGRTPLHAVCAVASERRMNVEASLDVVRCLVVEFGANMTAQTDNGETALHLASKQGCLPILRYLLKQASDVDTMITACDESGSTALHLACKAQHWLIVQNLLILYEDEDIAAVLDGWEAAITVVLRPTTRRLMKMTNALGETPLGSLCASFVGDVATNTRAQRYAESTFRLMIEHCGAEIDQKNDKLFGLTPLSISCLVGNWRFVNRMVTQYGASVPMKTRTINNPVQDGRHIRFHFLGVSSSNQMVIPSELDSILMNDERGTAEMQCLLRRGRSLDEEEIEALHRQSLHTLMEQYDDCILTLIHANPDLEAITVWRLWKRTLQPYVHTNHVDRDTAAWNVAMQWVSLYHRMTKSRDDIDVQMDDDNDSSPANEYPLHALLSCVPLLQAAGIVASFKRRPHDNHEPSTRADAFWERILTRIGKEACATPNEDDKVPLQIYLETIVTQSSLASLQRNTRTTATMPLRLDLGLVRSILDFNGNSALFAESGEDHDVSVDEGRRAMDYLHPVATLCLQVHDGNIILERPLIDDLDEDDYNAHVDEFDLFEATALPIPQQERDERMELVLLDVVYRMILADPRRFVSQCNLYVAPQRNGPK